MGTNTKVKACILNSDPYIEHYDEAHHHNVLLQDGTGWNPVMGSCDIIIPSTHITLIIILYLHLLP